MVQVYYTEQKTNNLKAFPEEEINGENFAFTSKWTHMVNPTDREIELVSRRTDIPEDMLKAALDEEERARIENEDGSMLILIDIPVLEEEEEKYYTYSTLPMGIIIRGDTVVTVCLKDTAVIRDFVMGRVKAFSTFKITRFVFQILYNVATKFLQYLRQIDKSSQRIKTELHKSMKNKELIQLLDLENSLVYFSTSLRSNDIVINRLLRMESMKKYEEDADLLDDVLIENSQAIEMCNIYRDILSGTMDAYASVISNNLNIVMKVLTSITLIISIPTLISGWFGMNVQVPWEGDPWGFWIVIGISLVIALIAGFFMWKKKLM